MTAPFTTFIPFDLGAGANVYEDGWRQMQRRTGTPGVVRDQLNGLSVFADSSGMQVKVNTGEIWAEGHWGQLTSLASLTIAANATGGVRRDLVVYRIDYVNNNMTLLVITGASGGAVPALTRNSSIFDGPLATVEVPNGAVTIAASAVLDSRWYGGPTTPTLADDGGLFVDKISTCPRTMVSGTDAANNGVIYATLTQCQRDATVSVIRYYLHTARVAGLRDLRVYSGYDRFRLSDRTGAFAPGDTTAAGQVHSDTLPAPLSIKAGEFVAIAYLCTGTSTAPVFGRSTPVINSAILNTDPYAGDPAGRWSTVFSPGGQTVLPNPLTVHADGTWNKRDRSIWFALG